METKAEKGMFSMEKQIIGVSVIVPVYKVEKYLDKCVESLISQTYPEIEIVLVDDGSPDNCPERCDRFAAEHSNVVSLHKENGGLSSARNYGVTHAKYDHIAFVDSDDYVEKTYIEDMVRLKEEFDADFVITRTCRENEDGTGKKRRSFESFVTDKENALYCVYAGVYVGWAAYGKLYPKSVLLKYPFPDGYYEDSACMYNIINEMDKVAIGNYGDNYHYVQHEGSILISPLNKKHFRIFEICREFGSFIDREYPSRKELKVFMYKNAVIQLLNLQKMPWSSYRKIFMKYRGIFRKNLKHILKNKKISRSNKIYFILLCTRPEIYSLAHKLSLKLKKD